MFVQVLLRQYVLYICGNVKITSISFHVSNKTGCFFMNEKRFSWVYDCDWSKKYICMCMNGIIVCMCVYTTTGEYD